VTIRQCTQVVKFPAPTDCFAVQLPAPTSKGTTLALACYIEQTDSPAPSVLGVADSLGLKPSRWRLSNEAHVRGGKLALWHRLGSHADVTSVTAKLGAAATGWGIALEYAGSPGAAVQALADLLREAA